MFLGTYEHSMDAKGRTSLPAKFREILQSRYDGRLILTVNFDSSGSCLVGYPFASWEELAGKYAQLSPFDPNAIRLRRLHVGSATEVDIDKQGRVLIPPPLREYAQLEREVVWAGNLGVLELWSKARWQDEQKKTRDELPAIMQSLAGKV